MPARYNRFNIYNIALVLFCVANLLELFVPRRDDANFFARMPIQVIDGGLLMLMWLALALNRNHWTAVTKATFNFIPLVIVFSSLYFLNKEVKVSDFAPYLRMMLWVTSTIYFYEMMLKFGMNEKLMRWYVITFLIAIVKKIIEGDLFESEKLGGGDTAALPLLFLIPVVLICFSDKAKIIVMSIVAGLILISLRRTVILGLVVCLPFIYKYVSARLKTSHLVILGILFLATIVLTWGYVGEAIFFRFQNLLTGDAGGDKDTYGSGRSEFYLTVWNSWMHTDLSAKLFGHGLTSVQKVLMPEYGISHVHNDILEIGHTFGFLGISIWLWFLSCLWGLRKQIKLYCPENLNLFYICFISYGIIALASGCILRITTMAFGLTVALLTYQVQLARNALSQPAQPLPEAGPENLEVAY